MDTVLENQEVRELIKPGMLENILDQYFLLTIFPPFEHNLEHLEVWYKISILNGQKRYHQICEAERKGYVAENLATGIDEPDVLYDMYRLLGDIQIEKAGYTQHSITNPGRLR